MDKPNRAERRKNRFGGGRATEHGGWPAVQPNPVFEADGAEAEPDAGAKPASASAAKPKAKPSSKAKPKAKPNASTPAAG